MLRYYGYLAHSGCCDIKGTDDARDFDEVCSAMDSLGFTRDEKHSIFCIISGIIQLGNITFSAALIKGKDGGTPLLSRRLSRALDLTVSYRYC